METLFVFTVTVLLCGEFNNGDAGDLWRYRAHYDVTLMLTLYPCTKTADHGHKYCSIKTIAHRKLSLYVVRRMLIYDNYIYILYIYAFNHRKRTWNSTQHVVTHRSVNREVPPKAIVQKQTALIMRDDRRNKNYVIGNVAMAVITQTINLDDILVKWEQLIWRLCTRGWVT